MNPELAPSGNAPRQLSAGVCSYTGASVKGPSLQKFQAAPTTLFLLRHIFYFLHLPLSCT